MIAAFVRLLVPFGSVAGVADTAGDGTAVVQETETPDETETDLEDAPTAESTDTDGCA